MAVDVKQAKPNGMVPTVKAGGGHVEAAAARQAHRSTPNERKRTPDIVEAACAKTGNNRPVHAVVPPVSPIHHPSQEKKGSGRGGVAKIEQVGFSEEGGKQGIRKDSRTMG